MLIDATLASQADSAAAEQVVRDLRHHAARDRSDRCWWAASRAIALDTNETAQSDLAKIIPIVLAVILVILMLLLRSVLAPGASDRQRGALLCGGARRLRPGLQPRVRVSRARMRRCRCSDSCSWWLSGWTTTSS